MSNKPKEVTLFDDVPELVWVENKEWKYGCFDTACKTNQICGTIKFRGQALTGYSLCFGHAKPFAVEILKQISKELDHKEACREAYREIADEKR